MAPAYPKQIILKNGERVDLRPLDSHDTQALLDFFAGLPAESTQFLKHNVRDPEVVRSFLRSDPGSIWAIVAVTAGGVIVGDATLHMTQLGWRRHVGEVRVVVAMQYHKQGLATQLIHELVNQASLKGLRKLKAEILDSQPGARRAFERLGFVEEARLKQHALSSDGQLHDIVILTNTVEDLWQKMEDLISDMEYSPDTY
jgi:RimJ/RimL family protein N-acetyltransferase